MTDDILKQLGARARERAREEEEEAEPGLPDGVPPFDASAEDRIVTRLLAKAEPQEHPAKERGATIVRPRRWITAATPIVALAAGIALFVTVRAPAQPGLPTYDLSVVSARQVRAPSPQPSATEFTVDPDGELEIVAHPAASVAGLRAVAFVIRSGDAKPWAVPIELSNDGALRIAGETRTLFPETLGGTTGVCDVAILVARKDALPSESEAIRVVRAAPTERRDLRIIRARIRFVEKK